MKIIFTDLDGTLLNNESTVSSYTQSVIKDWVYAGNLLVPNSGRSYSSIIEVVEKSGLADLVTYVIAYNGAVIWDIKHSRPVWEAKLDADIAEFIQDKAEELQIHAHTYYNEDIISPKDSEELSYYTRRIHRPTIIIGKPMSYVNSDVYKYLAINLTDRDKLIKLQNIVLSEFPGRVNSLFSNPYYLEFFNSEAGKGNALVELCKLYNVDIMDSYAAGDEENDISMIQAAGCGIAMKNATPPVLEVADVVTEYDNDQNGLAEYIKTI